VIIVIIGAPGAGKTTYRRFLADELGWPSVGIDDYRPRYARWRSMLADISATQDIIAESCIVGSGYRQLLASRPHLVVQVVTSERELGRRLRARGWKPRRIAMALPPPITPHVTVRGDL
jgi:broad-specificity NMP kinase